MKVKPAGMKNLLVQEPAGRYLPKIRISLAENYQADSYM